MTARHAISALRTRLALQAPVDTPDDAGGFNRGWTTIDMIDAAIMPTGGTRQFVAERQESATTHKILLRWRPDISAHMRLSGQGRVYEIISLFDADGRRRFMTCYCEVITTAGATP